jgi:hypothetical protein
MARRAEDAAYAYDAIDRMLAALRADSPEDALDIGTRALRARRQPEPPQRSRRARDAPAPPQRQREQLRHRLFALTRPEMILAPVNVVAVYLDDRHAMWPSWSWAETQAVNTRMLSLVRRAWPDLPVADDPRVALPLTVAGFFLYRALHVSPPGPGRPEAHVVEDIYEEIEQGFVTLDAQRLAAVTAKMRGEFSPECVDDFYDLAATARVLLFEAVRRGDEFRLALILECPLGPRCLKEAPYYIPGPGAGADRHPACRMRHSRARR